jgi:hypothetical protein
MARMTETAPTADQEPSDGDQPEGRLFRSTELERRVLGAAGGVLLAAAAIVQIAGTTAGNPGKSIILAVVTIVIGGSALIVITRTAPAMKKKFRISYMIAFALLALAGAVGGGVGYAISNAMRPGSSAAAAGPTTSAQTGRESRSVYCRALVNSAARESAALGMLQRSITVSSPSGRVTGHSAEFRTAFTAATTGVQRVITTEVQFKSHGGQVSSDPRLGGDLIQISTDLTNLQRAVLNRGNGGAQWNQLSNYQSDFQQLAQMACPR